ncbi:hypothetical protein ECLT68_2143 [Escherichia coli LT-68]|nr:hypothetical protein ECLT68_2143 [Escherichia coli LT-68]
MPQTIITARPIKIPGKYPAINSDATETPPAVRENTINTFEGGISNPVIQDETFTAVENAGS